MTNPISKTAEDLGLPEELVETVVMDMFKGIYHFLTNPHEGKFGIRLNPGFIIELKIFAVKDFVDKALKKEGELHPEQEYWINNFINLPWNVKNPKYKRILKWLFQHPQFKEAFERRLPQLIHWAEAES